MKAPAALIFGLALCLTFGSCGRDPRLNLLLITMDTTRADHLGCYGDPLALTPNIDRLAAEGAVYERCYTPVPITLPAHTSILTGTYPAYHGVHENNGFYVAEELETLAEVLKGSGYETAAFVGSFPLDSQTGLDQGFDLYDDHYLSSLERGKHPQLRGFYDERPAPEVVRPALDWLKRRDRDRPFFMWAHFFDPHQPYNPPAPYRELFADRPYDGEIAAMDEAIGRIVHQLKDQGLWDRTLVVLIADHGEGLGEHGELTHALLLYSSTVRVPLILRDPGTEGGRRVSEPVCSVDVMPSVLARLGLPVPAAVQGMVLPERDDPDLPKRSIPSETLYGALIHGWSPLERLTEDDWMLVDAPTPKLYHIAEDRDETLDLMAAETERGRAMKLRLQERLAACRGDIDAEEDSISPEKLARLAALGYVGNLGGVGTPRGGARPDLPDPHDAISAFLEMNEGKQLVDMGNPGMAVPILERARRTDGGNAFLLFYLASAYGDLGQWDRVAATLEDLLEIVPEHLGAHLLSVELLTRRGDADGAVHALRRCLELDPKNEATRLLLAHALEDTGRDSEARPVYEAILAQSPDQTLAANGYATLLYRLGETELSEEYLTELIARQPYYAPALLNLGVIRHDRGLWLESDRLARRAISLRTGYGAAWELHAMNLTELADPDAESAWRRALALAPDPKAAERIKARLSD